MAFFTRINLNVPVLPPDESAVDKITLTGTDHRRYASEPSRTSSNTASSRNASSQHNQASRKSSSPMVVTATSTTSTVTVAAAIDKISSNQIERDPIEINKVLQTGDPQKSTTEEEDGEPKRYEYVVDRVLGVEVWKNYID